MGFVPRLRIPSVVLMIAAGIVFGSSGVSLIQLDGPVQILALLGLAFLLFLAGLEIDVRCLRGNLLRVALAGYALTLALGGVAGMLFGILDWVGSPLLLGVPAVDLRVLAAAALLLGFVVLAQRVGLETILGAFMAGVIVAALDPDTTPHPRFRAKLEGIGYGFVVPVFFITSGLQLELHQ